MRKMYCFIETSFNQEGGGGRDFEYRDPPFRSTLDDGTVKPVKRNYQ